jgi:polysaccharide export outer membrane protein
MRARIKAFVAVIGFAFLSGCGGPNVAETVTLPDPEPYRLDNGDQLRVTVFGQDTLTGEYTVDGSGSISMPLLGQVLARGSSAAELEQQISDRLASEGYLVSPSVSVQILTYRPFFVLGEVNQPGQFTYIENMTVLTAIAVAGGFTHRASTDEFTITRKIGNKVIEARAQRNSVMQPGDVVYVHERIF